MHSWSGNRSTGLVEYNLKEYQFLNPQAIIAIFNSEYQVNSFGHSFETSQNEAAADCKLCLHEQL